MTASRVPLAVVTALREELGPLLARGRREGRLRLGPGRGHRLRLGPRPLVAAWTGDGAASAAEGLRALLARVRPGALLLMGVAGGLSPRLEAGDLIAARQVRDAAGPAPPPDPALLERAVGSGRTTPGILLTVERIATTPEEKARLRRGLGTEEPAAVDLETAVWARAAGELGVPYLAVRAVSDPAKEALPLDFNRFRDSRGRVRRLAVALHALRHPGMIGELRALDRRVRRCAERLADFVAAVYD